MLISPAEAWLEPWLGAEPRAEANFRNFPSGDGLTTSRWRFLALPNLAMTFTVCHGFSMAPRNIWDIWDILLIWIYGIYIYTPSGYLLHSHGFSMTLIEIDGLPNLKMGGSFHGKLLTRW